jgi:hypothetical protein
VDARLRASPNLAGDNAIRAKDASLQTDFLLSDERELFALKSVSA